MLYFLITSISVPLSLPVGEYYIKVKFSINKSVSFLSNNENMFKNNMFPLYNSFSKNVYFYILESPLKFSLIDSSKVSYNVNNTGFISANLNSVLFNNSLIKPAHFLISDSNINNNNNFKNNASLNITNPIPVINNTSNINSNDNKRLNSNINNQSNHFSNNSIHTANCNNLNNNNEVNQTNNIQDTLPHSKALPLKISNKAIQSNTCFNAFNNNNIYNNIGNNSYKNYTHTYLSNSINYQAHNNFIVNNNNKIYPNMSYNTQNLNNINNLNTTKNSLLNQAINSTYNTNTDNISQFKFFLPPELEKTVLDCNDNLSTQTVKKNFLYNKNSILRLEVDILRKRVMNILTDLKTYIDFNQNISSNNTNINNTSNVNNAKKTNNTSNTNIITNNVNNDTRIFDYNLNKFQQATSNSSRNSAFLESELFNKLVNSKVYKEISKKQNNSSINNTNIQNNITDTLTKKTQIYEVIFQEDILLFIELFFSLMNLNNKNPLFFVSKLDSYGCNLLHYFSALDYETPTVFLVKSNIFLMMKETQEEKLTIFEIASSKWNFNTLNALIKLNNSSKIENFKIDMKYIKSGLNLALDNSIFINDKNIEVLYLLLKQLRIEFMIDITSEKIIESIKNENLIQNNDSNELIEANDINNNLSFDDYENNEESSNMSKNSKYNNHHTNEYVNIKCNDNEHTHKAHNRADNNNNKKFSSISKLSKKNKNRSITNISSESNTFKSDKSQLSNNSLNTIKSVQSISLIMNSIKTFSDFRKDLSSYINNSLVNKSIEEDGSYQTINSISNSNKEALHMNSLNNINTNLNYNLINSINSINNINSLNEINNLTRLNPLNRKLDNVIKSPSLNNINALNTLSNMNEMNNSNGINDDINDDINDISQIIHKNQELTGLNDISNDLIQGLLNKPAISINKITKINNLNHDEITNLKNIISKRNDINQENQAKYVSTIQSCVRSFLQRNHYIDLKKNTMKLQTKLKNFMDRRKFVNMKNATITIQKAFRVFLKKK